VQQDVRWWNWPAPEDVERKPGAREAEVSVLVASDTGTIVGVAASYPDPLQEMVPDLVGVFGTTPQAPETFRVFYGGYPVDVTRLKYTCPNTIVRIEEERVLQGSRGVSVLVLDKEYVLESLRCYANSVAVSCDWLKTAVEGIANPDKPLGEITPIADCKADAGGNSRVILWFDKEQQDGYRRGYKAKEFGPDVPRAFDVAGAFLNDDTAAALIDPMVSASLGVRRLSSRSIDNAGLQSTIASTIVADMFWEVASILVQERFPPVGGKISVVRPHPDSPEGFAAAMGQRSSSLAPDAPPAERMQLFGKRVSGDRYEWMDNNGYRIRVGSNLAISIEKPVKSNQRGL
jgi:hypothetical protein